MIKVSIIGSGNVAQHLIHAFANENNIEILQVFARNPDDLIDIINPNKIVSDFKYLQKVDLFIIAVSDNSIIEVSAKIPFENCLVAHTSGSIDLNVLNSKNRKAVFYPLQTFSKTKKLNFKEIPICIEAQNSRDYSIIEYVAESISNNVQKIDSKQRKALHVAAVFVCNFTNHLYQVGNEICNENNINFEILKPLIQETANKILLLSPKEAQTGPAKRGDSQTINEHLKFLKNENQIGIYILLTKSIIDNGKKL
jgi:predicted short-subunit dehydrogenase-like oxidoreductase (DUF2520 family)